MSELTTIQLNKEVVEKLKDIKDYPRQTYNELLVKLVNVFNVVKKKNSYDEFLHKIQQPKMKEIWDNKDDEDWEDA
ncbi:hypothetical protein J4232_03765 [Candidatus Woesearchaeota archaeon]|nr:hypothetical protein [Candidatus Woesearchaeota archaeon]